MTGSEQRISVIIPTYNRAHLIIEALDSIAAQTVAIDEILVIDDGSTDDTANRVAAWSRSNRKVIYQRQDNAGGNVARNLGIHLATGDLITFLDSDDLWHPEKTRKQLERLEDQSYGAVYCGIRETVIGKETSDDVANRSFPQGQLLSQLLVRDVTAPTSTYMIRAEIFDEAGQFDERLKARQDWDMWIRVARETKIAAVTEALVDLRAHDGPRTVSDPTRELVAYKVILEKYSDLRALQPLAVRRSAIAGYYRRAGRVYYHHMGKPLKAIAHHLRAIATWPFVPDSYAALLGVFLSAKLRKRLHLAWNRVFGRTIFSIKSH